MSGIGTPASAPTLGPQIPAHSKTRSHSIDQASMQTMTHTGSDGSSPGDRISRVGYPAGAWAENVAYGYNSCSAVMSGWMNSAGHKANILNKSVVHIGVASAASSNGTLYWTMVLAG